MTMNNGGPAFPQQMVDTDRGRFSVDAWGCGGMSLRDWLAGIAMQGVIASGAAATTDGSWSSWAYGVADRMLVEGGHISKESLESPQNQEGFPEKKPGNPV